jgi:hypothetical protein
VEDPNTVVADLQSHTFCSHDGVISARANLRSHAACGCSLVAITEHRSPEGAFDAAALARACPGELPPVVPGVEVSVDPSGYLLALGLAPGRALARPAQGRDDPGFAARFVRSVHEDQGGAVIALNWGLTPQGVDALAEAGVDGFEIANFGHPDTPPDVREALLRASRTRGIALVASSDWHGWGGFFRTWTVIRSPGPPLPAARRADFVIRELTSRRAGDFVPVVAGHLGRPSPLRALFSPLVETLRYAAELSPLRVLSWWIWAAALFATARWLSKRGLPPGPVLLGALLLLLGTGLSLSGLSLLRAWAFGPSTTGFAAEVGAKSLALGAASVGASATLLLRVLGPSRRGITHPAPGRG